MERTQQHEDTNLEVQGFWIERGEKTHGYRSFKVSNWIDQRTLQGHLAF